ncbi:unnamed protein product [Urochloa humidicola]
MILESGHKYLVGQKIVSLQYKNSEEEDQSKVPKDAPKKSAYVQQTLPINHDDNMMKPVETTKLADGSGGIRVMPKGLIQVFRSEGNQKKAYLKGKSENCNSLQYFECKSTEAREWCDGSNRDIFWVPFVFDS